MRKFESRDIQYNPVFALLPGSDPIVALFLSFLMAETDRNDGIEVDATSDRILELTGLTYSQQARATKVLAGIGLVRKRLVGIPAISRYSVNRLYVYKMAIAVVEARQK